MSERTSSASRPAAQPGLVLAALGVVFGDIGTSPLYAMRECFSSLLPTPENVLGILSLIFWSLTLIISIKYVTFVMRADNRGEGGVLALTSLAQPHARMVLTRWQRAIVYVGIFGASLLYGDSVITPAISVLSAIEGINVATPLFEQWVIPATLVVLIGLFLLQARGTAAIGSLFGPVILVWFTTIGALGLIGIMKEPGVLSALNPLYGYQFFLHNGWQGFLALGAVFLCVTGGEALYADMGHFGRPPIRKGWLFCAMPALVLNYLGQGALLLHSPEAIENPFYHLAPDFALVPLVILATAATAIASQAVISGAFSVTSQAVKLGLFPRMAILHTSSKHAGQIYVPQLNWGLLLATIWLVLEFRTSSNLAAAYGIAVSTTMVITSFLLFIVMIRVWRWNLFASTLAAMFFLTVDLAFFGANIIKIEHGGWFPLAVAALIFTCMTTWQAGRQIMRQRIKEKLPSFEVFVHDIPEMTPLRVPGTAVYMSTYRDVTPPALLYNLRHNKVVHDVIVIVTVEIEEVPYVSPVRRVEVENFGRDIYRVTVRYGFMDTVDVPRALTLCKSSGLDIDVSNAIFFLGREAILPSRRKTLAGWRRKLFMMMSRNPDRASFFFGIRPDQIIELGFQIEL